MLWLFISMRVFANDPNFDTSTGIVTFPKVTVDNSSTFINVQLFLNPNGAWSILAAEPESTLNITGNWNGVGTSSSFLGCNAQITGSLIQNGNELTGTGSLFGNCVSGGQGMVTGLIDGNNITFGIALSNNTNISFNGSISNDHQTLTGTYVWPENNDQGTWSLSLQ